MAEIRLPYNWKPRDYQRPAWDYLERGGKHAELVWHRRSGKDELSLHRTACSMFERAGNYWHMLPKANQARKALWEAINPHTGKRRIDEAFPKEIRSGYNDHEMLLRVPSGSTWQVVGSDNFDSLVGSPPVGIVFSEWPLSDPSSWAYLRPIMAENGGWAIFNGTPRGKNHAYRTFRAAQKEPGHFAQRLTVSDTDVFKTDQLESERRQLIAEYGPDYGQSIYDQEYMCSFEAANLGAILGRWLSRASRDGRICDGVFDPEGAPIEISSDIGFRDTATFWFWQPRADGFGLVDFDAGSGLEADEWIDRLDERLKDKGYKLGRIWLPKDAKAKTFATRHSAMERFLSKYTSDVVRVVPQSKVSDRINAARRVIERCWFEESTTEEGREGLSAWKFLYDEERKEFSKDPDHDWASHYGDGFSYGAQVMSERIVDLPEEAKPLRGAVVALPDGGFSLGVSLEDMWKFAPKASARI